MIQFFHDKIKASYHTRKTIAVDVPDKSKLENLLHLNTFKFIELSCGYSLVNPKDNYVKAIGREVSQQKMEDIIFKLTNCIYTQDGIELYLEVSNDFASNDSASVRSLSFRLLPKAARAHLIQASLRYDLQNK